MRIKIQLFLVTFFICLTSTYKYAQTISLKEFLEIAKEKHSVFKRMQLNIDIQKNF